METDGLPAPDNMIFGEIQVLLAEKRTALAAPAHRYRRLRVASVGSQRTDRDLALLQH